MMYSTTYDAPTGTYTLVADDHGLVGVWLKGQKYYMYNISGPIKERPDAPYLTSAVAWLDNYFDGINPNINDLSLVPHGTESRRHIWNEIKKIGYGHTADYDDIVQALGSGKDDDLKEAIARNPLSIIIPCHRVVRANGKETGYSSGSDTKKWLLNHEGVDS
jgi:methylated-DNA--[protein]-cysteine S-methyltransferase